MRRALFLAALLATPALAGPGFVPVQGVLTDSSGAAIDGQVDVTFTLYSDSTGATSLWSDTVTLDVVAGRFATELGGNVPLDLDSFANFPGVHLQIQVSGDSAMPLVPLDHVPYAAWAEKTGEALTLEGVSVAQLRAEIPATTDIEAAARTAAFDTEAELTALLDDNYLPASYAPAWATLTGVPAGFADDSDDGFTTEAELTDLLDDNYVAAGYTPAWSALTGVPAGFADDRDDGFTTEAELTDLLDDNYLRVGEALSIGGDVAMQGNAITGLADPSNAQDASTKAYVDAAVATAVDQRFWYAKVNLADGTYVDRDGNTETITAPSLAGTTACSSGDSVCVHHNGSSFEISFLVPSATTVDPGSTGDVRINGMNNCWATAPGDNEWSQRSFANGVQSYASDLNGGHDACITNDATTQGAGGTHCLGLVTTGLYAASHTSFGVVCIQ